MRLGFNIDHVATLRNARGQGCYPDVVHFANIARKAGADQITAHLREDRRHIQDDDIVNLINRVNLPLNMEMAATQEMTSIACSVVPFACCLVPEKREEITTEGGLDVALGLANIKDITQKLKAKGIVVSLFVDPVKEQIEASLECGADAIEIHTGAYANASEANKSMHVEAIAMAAKFAKSLGLKVHAGHGIDIWNVGPLLAIHEIEELNIGYSIIARSLEIGLYSAIDEMASLMKKGYK